MGTTNYVAKPRYRTRGSFSPITSSYLTIDANCSSGTTGPTSYGTTGYNGEFFETWDVVNPNFTKRSRAGEILISPFRSLRESQTCTGTYLRKTRTSPVSCSSPVKYLSYDHSGPQAYWRGHEGSHTKVVRPSLISDSDIKSAIAVASTGAWEKSNSHSADILVDIAELRKTLQLLRDPIQSTSALLRKIKAGKRGIKDLSSNDVIDYANSMWLQYRYGIRPLVKSVQGVVKALDRTFEKKRETFRGAYSLKSSAIVNSSFSGNPLTSYMGEDTVYYTEVKTDEISIRTGLMLETEVSLSQELGVDASGLLTLPWELVPFSFVADWFANTNHFLGAIVPYLTKTPMGSWITTRRLSSTVFTVTGSTASPYPWTHDRGPVENRSGTFEEKVRSPGLSGPSLEFKPQALTKVFNDLRVLDAFALLHKQFLNVFTR